MNAIENNPTLTITSDNVNITNFAIFGNSSDAVDINGAKNVMLSDNFIVNHLDESKTEEYVNGTVNMPGYGVSISDSSDVKLLKNTISLFESGIFA